MKRDLVIFVLSTFFLFSGLMKAQPRAESTIFAGFWRESDKPVEASADRMVLELSKREVEFQGNVVVKQGDSVIYAERICILYGDKGRVKKMEAFGSVKLRYGDATASGEHLIYDSGLEEFRLLGAPRVVQANQMVKGKEMRFKLSTNKLYILEPELEWRVEGSK